MRCCLCVAATWVMGQWGRACDIPPPARASQAACLATQPCLCGGGRRRQACRDRPPAASPPSPVSLACSWMQGDGPEADAVRNKKFKLIPRIVKGRCALLCVRGGWAAHLPLGGAGAVAPAGCLQCWPLHGQPWRLPPCPAESSPAQLTAAPLWLPAPVPSAQLDREAECGHHARAAGAEADHPLLQGWVWARACMDVGRQWGCVRLARCEVSGSCGCCAVAPHPMTQVGGMRAVRPTYQIENQSFVSCSAQAPTILRWTWASPPTLPAWLHIRLTS